MPTRPPKAYAQSRRLKPQAQAPRRPIPRPHQSLYNTEEWKQASKAFRQLHPKCECDYHRGKPDAPKSKCVDHIMAWKGDLTLFWNRSNWRAMSWSCHSAKTNRQDGGFGNRRREKTC